MVVTTLYSIINLIRKHGRINSTNELAKLAIKDNICTRKTVFAYVPELKTHRSINCKKIGISDHWTFVDVTDSKNFNVQETLETINQLIEKISKEIVDIRKIKKRKISSNEEESKIKNIINIKIEILLEEHKLNFFESSGTIMSKNKESFDIKKVELRKLNLDLDKAIFKFNSGIAGSIFARIFFGLHHLERNTSP